MKKFDIPSQYKSSIISLIKGKRKLEDPRKKDYTPTELDFGPVKFYIARHFGFCYGVENAIEIAYKTLENNSGKKIYLLSEMIHNPIVNQDLVEHGIRFITDTQGNTLINWDQITSDDIVIIPAFGTTIANELILKEKGIDTVQYNTTCPFVEKVWNRAEALGIQGYTIIIHGKHKHEETRATFSHSNKSAPSVIVRNINEVNILRSIILGKTDATEFYKIFKGKYSDGFDIEKDMERIGVVNQTTMLASETQEIADLFRETMIEKFGEENIKYHFADTRDTLCYATNDNQQATYGLLEQNADIAVIVGGYKSSNTSHIVELLEQKYPSYFISDETKLISENKIKHFDLVSKQKKITENYIPQKDKVKIILTSGASCPDAIVDKVLQKLLTFFPDSKSLDSVYRSIEKSFAE